MRKRLHVEYPLFLSDFSMDLRKKLIKIRPVGVDLFHADERTDRHRNDDFNSRS